jgi:hypothetical protein
MNFDYNVNNSARSATTVLEIINRFAAVSIDGFWRSGDFFNGGLAARNACTKKCHKLAQLQLANDP